MAKSIVMRIGLGFACLCLATALFATDTPKTAIDESGRWRIGFRYWSHRTPYESASDHAFLAEVSKLGPEVPPPDRQQGPLRFRSGILTVIERLHRQTDKEPVLSKVRELSVEGMDGLKVGDRVIVFVDREQYKGGHVINYHEGGCLIGICLPAKDPNMEDALVEPLLKSLREGRTTLRQLTSEELSAWIAVDPTGIARQFQMQLDLGRLEWKAP
ncbi:MAG: hypothetical protein HS117_05470 [Verrucomicrobiaceae bacterium]|nr:hypothetical protein [Verrucomicrobiaceae bacterium]